MALAADRTGGDGTPRWSGEAEIGRMLVDGAFRKELGLEPGDLRIGLNVAKNLLDRGATAEAMRIYVALVLCNPTEVDFQVGLANCALRMEEAHLALQAASAVVAMNPRDPRGYFLSGSACLMLGQYSEAGEDFQDAVRFAKDARDHRIADLAGAALQRVAALSEPRRTAAG